MPNLILVNDQTRIDWTDTGGDETLDLGGLAAGAVRNGDRHDFGDVARSGWHGWRLLIDGFTTSPVVGETVLAYASTSDGTFPDGDIGTTDGAGTTPSLPNMMFLGAATVQTTTAGDELIVSGRVFIWQRFFTPVIFNNTVDILASSADDHHFFLTPVPDQIQDDA